MLTNFNYTKIKIIDNIFDGIKKLFTFVFEKRKIFS
jgi:hypothetical protein